MKFLNIIFILLLEVSAYSQNYTTYHTGNTADIQATPSGGVCLMGGATENDNAMRWFLQRANGGDILVLRASGSNGYNDYMYSQLGVTVNSVETIVFNNATAANETYIHEKIQQAEAIWIAGGNQWNYVSYWRNTPIADLINDAIANRNIVIGGTSAGMAIQGGFYFTAENGTVTSSTALSNPYHSHVTVDSLPFISNQFLLDVITDTHYDNPDRKGRHVVFLARILLDYGVEAKGIACDEYTAVCIDSNGIARVFGGYPNYDDNAYFLQTNCELTNVFPENCSPGNPLNWNLGNEALKVYKVKGTGSGAHTFDLNTWQSGNGGTWENWYVVNGILHETPGAQPNCSSSFISVQKSTALLLYPNPANDTVTIDLSNPESQPESLRITNREGQIIKLMNLKKSNKIFLNTSNLPAGIYFIEIAFKDKRKSIEKLVVI